MLGLQALASGQQAGIAAAQRVAQTCAQSLVEQSMDPQTRNFIGVAAAAIKTFFLLLIKVINVVDQGVSMADKAVTIARERQHVEMDLAQEEYNEKLERQASLRTVKDEVEVQRFVAADPERAKLMLEARANIRKIIAKSRAELASKEAA